MTSSPELPVPDAALDAAIAQLTTEDGWIPARSGPTGSDLDQYCSPDGKLNDAEGLRAADEAAASFNRESLRRALAPIVGAELRRMADGYAAGDTISESFARDLHARADEIERQQP